MSPCAFGVSSEKNASHPHPKFSHHASSLDEKNVLLRLFIFTLTNAVLLLGIPSKSSCTDRIYHIAPNGNDVNPGTVSKPFRTIQHAQQSVRTLVANGLNTNVTLFLHKGIYRITSPVMFDVRDSGTEKHHITWSAYNSKTVIISGGREIKGWKKLSNGNWQVSLPKVKSGEWNFRELFVNGKRATRARFPNDGYLRIQKAGADHRTNFTFYKNDLPSNIMGNQTELELDFLHDWSMSRIRVASIDQKTNTLTTVDPIGCRSKHFQIDHFEKHPRYFLENSLQLLDAAGEWFLDRSTGLLTYRPQKGETLRKSSIVAPVAFRLIDLKGTPKKPVQNLQFIGLSFHHCNWTLPPHGYAEGQAAFHEVRDGSKRHGGLRIPVPAAVVLENATQCKVVKCNFKHLGGTGISFEKGCHNCLLSSCRLSDISANAAMVGHDCSGNQLRHNSIKNIGQQFYGSVGIWIGLANHTVVSNNELSFLPYTGISVGWKWNSTPTNCHNNRIENNHIHHVMQVLSDGAGIYTLGRQPGTILRKNHIHDISVNTGKAESNGIFMDQGTSGLLVEKNNIYNIARSPLRFNHAEENTIRRNRFVTKSGVSSIRYNGTKKKSIKLIENKIIEQP